MKFKEYIIDRKYLFLFYIVLMLFIIETVYFGNSSAISDSDLLYIIIVSLTLFSTYIAIDFFPKKTYYKKLHNLLESTSADLISILPNPPGLEQRLNTELLQNMHAKSSTQVEDLIGRAREDIDFITTWVHQIKTPIAVSKLIVESSLNNPTDKTLISIEEELDKIEGLVLKALFNTRTNDFARDYMVTGVNIESVVKECIKKQSKSFIRKKIGIQMDNLNHEVLTDKKWMCFIIDQILSNSLKYTDACGLIKSFVEVCPNELLLHFEDTGIGIRPEDLSRVFEKNFTGYNGREHLNSTGIGLYLSQKLAKRLGHYLSISSKLKEGTIVTIHFPKWSNYYDLTKM